MKKTKKATSIVEAMVILLILLVWIIWMYTIYDRSKRLSDSTKYRIEAIEIAREWLEAIKNIRDTNYILFWADTENCWNVLNYNISCIWSNDTTNDIQNDTSYIIYQDSDNRWKLNSPSWVTTYEYNDTNYRNNFQVYKDINWFYTQSWGTNFNPIFTREIKISYLDTSWNPWDSNNDKMKISSLVQWVDRTSNDVHKINLDLELNNWKK